MTHRLLTRLLPGTLLASFLVFSMQEICQTAIGSGFKQTDSEADRENGIKKARHSPMPTNPTQGERVEITMREINAHRGGTRPSPDDPGGPTVYGLLHEAPGPGDQQRGIASKLVALPGDSQQHRRRAPHEQILTTHMLALAVPLFVLLRTLARSLRQSLGTQLLLTRQKTNATILSDSFLMHFFVVIRKE